MQDITKQADILVVAIGKPKFVTEEMVKEGAIVIDVGINRVDGKLVGDVDFENVSKKASFVTSANNNSVLSTKLHACGCKQFHYSVRSATYCSRIVHCKQSKIIWTKSVNILAIWNQRQQISLVKLFWQWQLNQNAIHIAILCKLFYDFSNLIISAFSW